MKKLAFNTWGKAQCLKQKAKDEFKAFIYEEDGGPEAIIIGVIMIIIVVALAIVFRDQIGNWLNKLFKSADDEISNITSGGNFSTIP